MGDLKVTHLFLGVTVGAFLFGKASHEEPPKSDSPFWVLPWEPFYSVKRVMKSLSKNQIIS